MLRHVAAAPFINAAPTCNARRGAPIERLGRFLAYDDAVELRE